MTDLLKRRSQASIDETLRELQCARAEYAARETDIFESHPPSAPLVAATALSHVCQASNNADIVALRKKAATQDETIRCLRKQLEDMTRDRDFHKGNAQTLYNQRCALEQRCRGSEDIVREMATAREGVAQHQFNIMTGLLQQALDIKSVIPDAVKLEYAASTTPEGASSRLSGPKTRTYSMRQQK